MRLAKVYRSGFGNALVGDLFDSTGMGYYRGVRFLSSGGGDGANAIHIPTALAGGDTDLEFERAPEVIVAFGGGSRPRAYILGVLSHVEDNLRVNGSDEETKDGEYVVDFNGARIVLTEEGNIRLDVTHDAPDGYGYVRVAHRKKLVGGTSTLAHDERVLLGRKFATDEDSYINQFLIAKIDEMGAQIEALTSQVSALIGAGTTLTDAQAGYKGAVAATAGIAPAYVHESPISPGSVNLSRVFRISEVSDAN